jgi:hypothetical protein
MRVFNNFISLTITMFFILLGWATTVPEYAIKMETKLILDSTAIELKNLETFDLDSASIWIDTKVTYSTYDSFRFELIKTIRATSKDTIFIKDFKSRKTAKTFLEEGLKIKFLTLDVLLKEKQDCGCTKCKNNGLFTEEF